MAGAAPDSPDDNRPLVGVLWMLVTGLCFVTVTALVKHVGDRIPAPEAAFVRYGLGLVFLLPALGTLARVRLRRKDLALFSARGAAHGAGVICWFFAMTQIPIAEVTAMNYLSPVWITLGAALFLGEKLAARRLLAVFAALLGALVILRPGMREVSPGHLAMLGTALLFGGSYLMAKRLTSVASPVVIVAMLSLTVTIVLAPVAAAVWVTPTWAETGWLFCVGGVATAGHTCMTMAFRAAPVTVTQPVTFLQLVWATILGATLFGEPVDPFVVLGGGLILSAVSFITWREAMLRRRQAVPAAGAATP